MHTDMNKNDDPDAPMTLAIGALGALAILIIVLGVQALYYSAEQSVIEKSVYSAVPEEYRQLRADQEETLHSYRWIDEANNVLGIPIDRAIALTAQELAREARAGAAKP